HIRIFQTVDMTIFKQDRSCTEDKICGAFNITVDKIHPGMFSTGIHSVLVADEPAVSENSAVSFYVKRYCLPHRACSILKRDVLGIKFISHYPHGIGSK